jgi:hypothetical protein
MFRFGDFMELAMADGAVGQSRLLPRGEGMPIGRVWRGQVRENLRHLGDGDEVAFRLAMAIEAPRHIHLDRLVGHGHLVDTAMAGHTCDAARDMDAVIEVDVIGNSRDLLPCDGNVPLSALTDRL